MLYFMGYVMMKTKRRQEVRNILENIEDIENIKENIREQRD